MSQFSKMHHSRDQWKHKAKQRGERERSQRQQHARLRAERDRATQALKETQARLRQLEAQRRGLATVPKVDMVSVTLLAVALGIKTAPCPQTIINGVIRLSIVRIDSARTLRGFALSQAPFSNGLIWMLDLSIGLGTGKIVAVLAIDAHHHQLCSSAP